MSEPEYEVITRRKRDGSCVQYVKTDHGLIELSEWYRRWRMEHEGSKGSPANRRAR